MEARRRFFVVPRGMKLRGWVLAVSAAIVIGGITVSLFASGARMTPQQRAAHIESQVKCPSCDGISALDSNTAGAFAVRSFVSGQIKAGKTDSQIINSLEASYGPTILMSPPPAYGGVVIAALPFVFVAVVLGTIGFFGYRRLRRPILEMNSNSERDAATQSSGEPTDGSDGTLAAPLPGSAVSSDGGSQPDSGGVGSRASSWRFRRPGLGRRAWLLYLGIILLLGGVGSGVWVIRGRHNASVQLAAAAVQANNEAQTILQARVLANEGQDVQALKLFSAVLDLDPTQPVALAYQGWLLCQAGAKDNSGALVNQGEKFLEQAVKLDPGYPDARLFLGLVLYKDRHDVNGAIAQFNAFLTDKPSSSFIDATRSDLVSAYKAAGLPVPPQLG